MEVIILPLFSSVASKPSRDMLNWRDSSFLVDTPWCERYSASWPCQPLLSPAVHSWLPPPPTVTFLPLLPSITLPGGATRLSQASFAEISPCTACHVHPGRCFQLPLTLHCGFRLPVSNRRLLYRQTPREIVPNCPLSCGKCAFPVLGHVQIIEAPFALEGGEGMAKSEIKQKKLNTTWHPGSHPGTVKAH